MNVHNLFARTKCSCEVCKNNCRTISGVLVAEDLIRIMFHLDYGDCMKFAAEHLNASPGAIAISAGQVFRIPTLVPARAPSGVCHWLDPAGKCEIHSVAPAGCALFDCKQSKDYQDTVSKEIHKQLMDQWARPYPSMYAQAWCHLWQHGMRARGPEEVRRG